MKRVSVLILLTVATLSVHVYGQTNTTVYGGHIQNHQGEAVDYATVVLLRNGDQIAGGVTDSIGIEGRHRSLHTHYSMYRL